MALMYLNPLFLMHPTVKFYLLNMDDCKTTAMNQRREFLAEGHRHLEETLTLMKWLVKHLERKTIPDIVRFGCLSLSQSLEELSHQ
jgi:hypothetical protein